jgi:DNA-binding NarL/FixJ family response regulator
MSHTTTCRRARILLVDDHAEFRADARALLELAGYDVIGEAADAASAVDATRHLHPDVLLLDIQLPDRDGFTVADELAAGPDTPQIVLISSREADDYGSRLQSANVTGFIHKSDLSRASIDALLRDGN